MDSELALEVLNALPGIGPIALQKLLNAYSDDPVRILERPTSSTPDIPGFTKKAADSISNWRKHVDTAKLEKQKESQGAEFISILNNQYPQLLGELDDGPIGLYCKGKNWPNKTAPLIAFVGTRRATLYGMRIAKEFAGELSRKGCCIVSGMARGIDTAAHEGALESDGKTIAVLGCGLDIIYPPENQELFRTIGEKGVLISEFPFGRRADRQTFPMRNRIISGMCSAIVVVESAANGGAMITAQFAAEQNRTVFAIPGRIDQASSKGCHELIRQGATLVSSPQDILNEMAPYLEQPELFHHSTYQTNNASVATQKDPRDSTLSEVEKVILNTLREHVHLDTESIAHYAEKPLHELFTPLLSLEMKGCCKRRGDGEYELA